MSLLQLMYSLKHKRRIKIHFGVPLVAKLPLRWRAANYSEKLIYIIEFYLELLTLIITVLIHFICKTTFRRLALEIHFIEQIIINYTYH